MTLGKYFNRGVMALNLPHLGYVVRETVDKIIEFSEKNNRYNTPKSEIQMTGRNVLIGQKVEEIAKKIQDKARSPVTHYYAIRTLESRWEYRSCCI
jgi:hypothetical protein